MKSNHLENYKISLKNQSIESLFLELGVDWRNMEINKPIDVSGQNYVVSSFDENELKNVYSKILKIVRKDDQKTCKIKTKIMANLVLHLIIFFIQKLMTMDHFGLKLLHS